MAARAGETDVHGKSLVRSMEELTDMKALDGKNKLPPLPPKPLNAEPSFKGVSAAAFNSHRSLTLMTETTSLDRNAQHKQSRNSIASSAHVSSTYVSRHHSTANLGPQVGSRRVSADSVDRIMVGTRRRSSHDAAEDTGAYATSQTNLNDPETTRSNNRLDKPTIVMYPRRSVHGGSSSSLRRSSLQSNHTDGRSSIQLDKSLPSSNAPTNKEPVDTTASLTVAPRPVIISVVSGTPIGSEEEVSRNTNMNVIEEEQQHSTAEQTPTQHAPVLSIETSVQSNQEYFHYLLQAQQRLSSSNFIQKVDSSEIVWKTEDRVIKMIGPYLLGDQIGKGSFGKVKEGICSERLQRVAVKVVNRKRLRKVTNGVENMVREIKLLRRLKHKNVICLMDVYCKVEDEMGNIGVFHWYDGIEDQPIRWRLEDGREEDRMVTIVKWYLVLEYCPLTLQTLLENTEGNKLSLPMAHRFFSQLTDGLAFLHSRGVIHRDIKAGNLLITTDGTLKISDFGVSEEFPMYTPGEIEISAFAGTHQFLSPEIAEGATSFSGPKVDVWASAVTLYNMVTGGYPFEFGSEGNLLDLYDRIAHAEFTIPEYLSHELTDLIRGMLRKDAKQRFSIDQIITHPWVKQHFPLSLTNQPMKYAYPPPESPDGSQTPSPASPTRNVPTTRTDRSPRKSSIFQRFSRASLLPIHPETPKPVTPVMTTLTPFLEDLFAEEIEEELRTKGTIDDFCFDSDELEERPSSPTKAKMKLWMASVFKSRKSISPTATSPT